VLTDYHMHLAADDLPYRDESFSPEHIGRYVARAQAAGVAEIGFTDHVYRFSQARDWFEHPLWQGGAVADLDRYHAAVQEAREAGMPVRVALEVDYLAGRERPIADLVDRYRWDYLLGSVHWVAGLAVDWDRAPIWDRYPTGEVWRRYCGDLCAAAASGIYDSMAHPDLAKVFGRRPEPRPLDLYREVADAFQAAGVCAEVSTAGYRRALGELYPDPQLLAMLRERGVPVTLGSDAHAPEGVGRDFDRALGELRAAGYRTLTVFDARQRRQVAFDE
jgi:histidinol-phosphatase (PHP family)